MSNIDFSKPLPKGELFPKFAIPEIYRSRKKEISVLATEICRIHDEKAIDENGKLIKIVEEFYKVLDKCGSCNDEDRNYEIGRLEN